MTGLGGKALGSVSCPYPCKSWLFLAFQWPRGCSWLSLRKKLLPNSYVLIMMAQEGAALMILGRKPVMGGQTLVRGLGPFPFTHKNMDVQRKHAPRQAPTCKESPGARFSLDSPKQEPGGINPWGLHCRFKAQVSSTQFGPCLPSAVTSPGSPLMASTAPSAICRWVFTTSKGRVRVAATWWDSERARLGTQAPVQHFHSSWEGLRHLKDG